MFDADEWLMEQEKALKRNYSRIIMEIELLRPFLALGFDFDAGSFESHVCIEKITKNSTITISVIDDDYNIETNWGDYRFEINDASVSAPQNILKKVKKADEKEIKIARVVEKISDICSCNGYTINSNTGNAEKLSKVINIIKSNKSIINNLDA